MAGINIVARGIFKPAISRTQGHRFRLETKVPKNIRSPFANNIVNDNNLREKGGEKSKPSAVSKCHMTKFMGIWI